MFLLLILLAAPCPAAFDQLGDCTITCSDTQAHIVSASGRELDVLLTTPTSALTQSGVCHRTTRAAFEASTLADSEPVPEAIGFIANTGRLNQIAVAASAEPFQRSGQLRVDYLRTVIPGLDIGPSVGCALLAGDHYPSTPFWFSVVTVGLQLRGRIAKLGPATFGIRSLVDVGYGVSDETTYNDFDFNRTVGWSEAGAFVGGARVEALVDVHLGRFVLFAAVFGGVVWEVSGSSKGAREWNNVSASAPNPARTIAAPAFGARVGTAVAVTKSVSLNVNAEVANVALLFRNRYLPVTFTLSAGPSFVF